MNIIKLDFMNLIIILRVTKLMTLFTMMSSTNIFIIYLHTARFS